MKTPDNESLELAAMWLDSNDGDEAVKLKPVVRWLRELAAEQQLEVMIRQQFAANYPEQKLAPAMLAKIKRQLVAKYGKPTQPVSRPSVSKP